MVSFEKILGEEKTLGISMKIWMKQMIFHEGFFFFFFFLRRKHWKIYSMTLCLLHVV